MAQKSLPKTEARERLEKLKRLIKKYRYHRLVLDSPLIAESAEDALKKELFDLEQRFPELVTPDSPTQRIGGEPLDKFKKVSHTDRNGEPSRMFSLNDAFSREDIEDWIERLEKVLGKKPKEFFIDLKMDGLAIELVYENNVLVQAATRGDGETGEEVTQNIKTIESIPLALDAESPFARLVVRGEAFLTTKEFEKINREQKKHDKKEYANPRNVAAGSIRQLDPKITAKRNLAFFAYGIVGKDGDNEYLKEFPMRENEYNLLKKLGIPTNPHWTTVRTVEDIEKYLKKWEKRRAKLPYEIDGIVVSINDNRQYFKAGITGKSRRSALAYKFSPKEATTVVKDIIVSVGRTGTLTPVAVLEPVEIGGVTVTRATLHNEDEIKRLGIKIGDTVVVGRAGDVIPDVREVLTDLRAGKEKVFHMPKKCPVCSHAVSRAKGEAAHRCTNKNCPAVRREGVYHFVSKDGFDIEGLGPKIIDQLFETGLIENAADLFSLKQEDLQNLPRFAEKSARNIVDALHAKKKIALPRFLYSLGIRHVGAETAFDLAHEYGTLDAIRNASEEELNSISNIGSVVAQSIYKWFRDDYNKKLLQQFNKAGVKALPEKKRKVLPCFADKTFVFTGSLESMTREDAQRRVRELGGDVSSSVSKETDYLVSGEEAGSKYERAKKRDVRILSEKEFLDMLP